MADYLKSTFSGPGIFGALQALSLGGPCSWRGDGTYARHLQVGFFRSDTEGTPLPPSFGLRHIGFWRFKWAVTAGARTISVYSKQAVNLEPRPKMVIKANPDVGLLADVTASKGAGTGWGQIISGFVPTATGVVWVELHNALPDGNYDCFFDHITTT